MTCTAAMLNNEQNEELIDAVQEHKHDAVKLLIQRKASLDHAVRAAADIQSSTVQTFCSSPDVAL